MENQRLSILHEMVARKLSRVRAQKPGPDLSKTFSLAEVEGLLAAERERAANVALTVYEWPPTWTGKLHEVIAAAIRSLPPKPIGGE